MIVTSASTKLPDWTDITQGCELEPIQYTNLIQPYARLLALDRDSGRLVALSANISEASQRLFAGITLQELLSREACDRVAAALEQLSDTAALDADSIAEINCGAVDLDGVVYECHLYQGEAGLVFLELETSAVGARDVSLDAVARMTGMSRSLSDLAPYLDQLARSVKEITGFDRVMVYQFHGDGHGEVVAESREANLEPFLGLHYPASDIPATARELYLRYPVRSVADVQEAPVPILMSSAIGALNIGGLAARSLSPIHVRYLSNMGVRASFSISLIVNNFLWGLIACHHHSAYRVTANVRVAGRIISQIASAQIGAFYARGRELGVTRSEQVLASIVSKVLEQQSLDGHILEQDLLTLIAADGLALIANTEQSDRIVLWGQTPTEQQVSELYPLIQAAAVDGCFVSESVKNDLCSSLELAEDICGVAALVLPSQGAHGIIWFRREYSREVRWAGDPRKKLVPSSEFVGGLSPRSSFSVWCETVRDRAHAFSANEISFLQKLRTQLLEIWLGKVQRAQLETLRTKQELEEFLMAVSHDLRSPIVSMLNTVRTARRQIERGELEAGQQQLDKVNFFAGKMDQLVQDLVRFGRLGSVTLDCQPFEPASIIKEVLNYVLPRYPKTDFKIVVDENMCSIRADVRRFEQIVANMVGNSIKHNLDQENLIVRISQRDFAENTSKTPMVEFCVSDNGSGVPVSFIERMFVVFEQLDPKKGGSGVGLAVVKRLVEMHGGQVRVESNTDKCAGEPTGTRIFFTMPSPDISYHSVAR